MPNRFELGGADYPGQIYDEHGNEISKPSFFFEAFSSLFSEGTLQQGLPTPEPAIEDGTYLIRVSLGNVWRTIALSGKHSLEDLHLVIQDAFDFNNDHLYSFSLDHRRLSPRKSFNDPRASEPPFADEAIVGQMSFYKGQRMLYVFDFGDWWEFDIEIIDILDESHEGSPKILQQKGENPQQYPDYDEEW
jgi:hypothetical protein